MTGIEWTDETWNPVTGCTKVSPGCAHCYAEGVARRLWRGRPFAEVRCHEDRLTQPLHWRRPRRVFVGSMSDLFHEAVPDKFIDQVFAVMARCPGHAFQVLTKRPERMRNYIGTPTPSELKRRWMLAGDTFAVPQPPPPNVWLGVSVENQAAADERVPQLLDTPAAVRFASCEPLLGPVDLTWLDAPKGDGYACHRDALGGRAGRDYQCGWDQPDEIGLPSLDWVIVGGESGPGARRCNVR